MNKLIVSVCVSAIFGYAVSIFSINKIDSFIYACIVPCVALFSAVLIGAVGVYLNIINNMYNAIKSSNMIDEEKKKYFFDKIEVISKEIKENVVVALYVSAFIIGAVLLLYVDIPTVKWNGLCYFATKLKFVVFLVVSCFILLFFIVIDTIRTMFFIHETYHFVTNGK